MPHASAVLVLVLLQLALALPATAQRNVTWGRLASAPPATGPVTSPSAAVHELAASYEALSVERLDSLLTADFRFHGDSDWWDSEFPDGIDRRGEMGVVHGLLRGVRVGDSLVAPPVQEVRMRAEGLVEAADPEHPDSTDHYRLVAVERLTFDIVVSDSMQYLNKPTVHTLHLVRGDAAVLPAGRVADSRRWYVRRWLENVGGVAERLATIEGDCAEDEAAVVGSLVPGFALRPLRNPSCPTLDMTCVLSEGAGARLEVYDVMGRRVKHQELAAGAAGPRRVQAGAGVTLSPGVYYVRLAQGARHDVKMVVVAR